MIDVKKRLLSKFTVGDDCWEWTGSLKYNGYGHVYMDGSTVSAHRTIYEWLVGPIPDGLELDHLCHDPAECPGGFGCPHRRCVRPDHLEPVTHAENVLRGGAGRYNAIKDECKRGHQFTKENTTLRSGGRTCRECERGRSRAYYLANRDRILDAQRVRDTRLWAAGLKVVPVDEGAV